MAAHFDFTSFSAWPFLDSWPQLFLHQGCFGWDSTNSNGVSLAADPTPLDNFVDCDTLMRKAYGATLIQSGSCSHSDWH